MPIRITSEPNRRHLYTIAAGYGTDTGARGTLGWEDRRLNDSGHRLRAQVRASGIEDSVGLTYAIPWTDPALEKLSFELRAFTEQNADIETSGSTFKVGLTQVRGRWQRVLSVTLDSTEDKFTRLGRIRPVSRNRSQLLVPGITFARLPPDFLGTNALPTGFRAEVLASTSAARSDTNFTRVDVRDDRRFKLNDDWQIYVRAEIGASVVGDFEELPAQYRFFAGGDQSVRGYGYEELSPVDADGNKVGGRHLLTATFELQRMLPKNLVGAVFVDAGNAFDNFGDPLEYSAASASLPAAVPERRHRRRAVDLGHQPQPALPHQLHAGVLRCPGRRASGFKWALAGFAALLLAVALAATWLVTTEAGLRRAVTLVESVGSVTIRVEGASGRLIGPLIVDTVEIEHPRASIRIAGLQADYEPLEFLAGRISAEGTTVREAAIALHPATGPARPPSFMPGWLTVAVDDAVVVTCSSWRRTAPRRGSATSGAPRGSRARASSSRAGTRARLGLGRRRRKRDAVRARAARARRHHRMVAHRRRPRRRRRARNR